MIIITDPKHKVQALYLLLRMLQLNFTSFLICALFKPRCCVTAHKILYNKRSWQSVYKNQTRDIFVRVSCSTLFWNFPSFLVASLGKHV